MVHPKLSHTLSHHRILEHNMAGLYIYQLIVNEINGLELIMEEYGINEKIVSSLPMCNRGRGCLV
jgi:hypothetical protein